MGYTLTEYLDNAYGLIGRTQSDAFLTNTMGTQWLNRRRRQVWQLLIDLNSNIGSATGDITVVKDTSLYDLPDDFWKLRSVRRKDGSYNNILTIDPNVVSYGDGDVNSPYFAITGCGMQDGQLKILESANGTVEVSYWRDINEYVYDGSGDYVNATEEPDLPIYTQDAVLNGLCMDMAVKGGDRDIYSMFLGRYQQNLADIDIAGDIHVAPLPIESRNIYGIGNINQNWT